MRCGPGRREIRVRVATRARASPTRTAPRRSRGRRRHVRRTTRSSARSSSAAARDDPQAARRSPRIRRLGTRSRPPERDPEDPRLPTRAAAQLRVIRSEVIGFPEDSIPTRRRSASRPLRLPPRAAGARSQAHAKNASRLRTWLRGVRVSRPARFVLYASRMSIWCGSVGRKRARTSDRARTRSRTGAESRRFPQNGTPP